jgi:hypothetical protein
MGDMKEWRNLSRKSFRKGDYDGSEKINVIGGQFLHHTDVGIFDCLF